MKLLLLLISMALCETNFASDSLQLQIIRFSDPISVDSLHLLESNYGFEIKACKCSAGSFSMCYWNIGDLDLDDLTMDIEIQFSAHISNEMSRIQGSCCNVIEEHKNYLLTELSNSQDVINHDDYLFSELYVIGGLGVPGYVDLTQFIPSHAKNTSLPDEPIPSEETWTPSSGALFVDANSFISSHMMWSDVSGFQGAYNRYEHEILIMNEDFLACESSNTWYFECLPFLSLDAVVDCDITSVFSNLPSWYYDSTVLDNGMFAEMIGTGIPYESYTVGTAHADEILPNTLYLVSFNVMRENLNTEESPIRLNSQLGESAESLAEIGLVGCLVDEFLLGNISWDSATTNTAGTEGEGWNNILPDEDGLDPAPTNDDVSDYVIVGNNYFVAYWPQPVAPISVFPINSDQVGGLVINFEWLPADRAISYELAISTTSSFTNETTYVIDSEVAVISGFGSTGEQYWWRVRAWNQYGYSTWSTTSTFTNTDCTGGNIPTANAGPNVTIVQGGSTTLQGSGGSFYNWVPATGLSNPNIWNPVAAPTVTTVYTLTVTNSNGCSDSDQVTVTVNSLLNCTNPATPSSVSPGSLSSGSSTTIYSTGPTLSWNSVIGAESYDINISISPYGSQNIVYQNLCYEGGTTLVVPPGELIAGGFYRWDVQANAEANGNCQSCNSGYSADRYFNVSSTINNGPNLTGVITDITSGVVAVGESLTIDYTVSNIGNSGTVIPFQAKFFLSSDGNFSEADYISNSNNTFSALGSNQSQNSSESFVIPSVNEGMYYLTCWVDSEEDISEADEYNNVFNTFIYVTQGNPSLPDIDLYNVNATPVDNLAPGMQVLVTWGVENQGSADAGVTDVGIFLSEDNDWDNGDIFLDAESSWLLDAGEEDDTESENVILPNTLPDGTGTYYLILVADYLNEEIESNELNNYEEIAINITNISPATPDYFTTSHFFKDINGVMIPDDNLPIGEEIFVEWTETNGGNLDFNDLIQTRIWISSDPFVSDDDFYMGSQNFNAGIDIGEFDPSTEDIELQDGASLGDFFLIIRSDYAQTVYETNEINNDYVVPITIIQGDYELPDLAVEIMSIDPYSSELGDTLSLLVDIWNSGEVPVSGFSIGFFVSFDMAFDGDNVDYQTYLQGGTWITDTIFPGDTLTQLFFPFTQNLVDIGSMYMLAVIDEGLDIPEMTKLNNESAFPIEIVSLDCYYHSYWHSDGNGDGIISGVVTYAGGVNADWIRVLTEPTCSWQAIETTPWLTITTASIETGTQVFLPIVQLENPYPISRYAPITIQDEVLTVEQLGKPCELIHDSLKVTISGVVTNETCSLSNGAIGVELAAEYYPLDVVWSNGLEVEDIENLSSGVYTIQVIDAAGCLYEATFVVAQDSCVGCTDENAYNFNPAATIDDGSCLYSDCPGDLNGDMAVSVSDLLLFSSTFGCVGECGPSDLNEDGVVGISDFLLFAASIGQGCP